MPKRKPYVPPYPLVAVVWNDAASNSETWVTLAEIAGPEQVITVGWLVKEAADSITIAGSVANEAIHNETVGNTMTIPIGMIVSRHVLRPAHGRGCARRGS